MDETGIRQLRAEIPAELFERAKIQAVRERTTLKSLIIEALEKLLAEREGGTTVPGGGRGNGEGSIYRISQA